MQARDIMATKVVTVGPEDRVEEVAKTLLARSIAAARGVEDRTIDHPAAPVLLL